MNRRIVLGMLTGAALLLSACGSDDGATDTSATLAAGPDTSAAEADGITIDGAWARNSPMMATAGAAYMTISSTAADRLVGASVDPSVAAKVEIHETRMVDGGMGSDTTMMGGETTMPGMGAMEMVPVDSLDIPADTPVELAPGGYHLMILDLAAPLELGSTFSITLRFEQAGERTVEVVVADAAP